MVLISAGSVARDIQARLEQAGDHRRGRRLRAAIERDRNTDSTIYFLTPDYEKPSGGIRVIYRHVEILNDAGIRAFVLHAHDGFRCNWFQHRARVTHLGAVKIGPRDLLVIPEVDVDLLDWLPAGQPHVIFNQNTHLTWRKSGPGASGHYRQDRGLLGAITVSSHNQSMLLLAFPALPVHRVHLGIDPATFFAGDKPTTPRITYMPRRALPQALQVLEIVKARGVLHGWEIHPLDGLSHEEVAAALRASSIFLAFTHQEGFGLPAAEAMACGNYVIGQHGFGGREFFRSEFSAPIESGDSVGLVQALEGTLTRERREPGWCQARGRTASAFILAEYGPARERADVVGIYGEMVKDVASR